MKTSIVKLAAQLPLQRAGRVLGGLTVRYAEAGDAAKPAVLLCPSMSNSPHPLRLPNEPASGWWECVVGHGSSYGIDLNKWRVIVPSPLGSPFGSTSPLTPSPDTDGSTSWGPRFPEITPYDQAGLHALLLDHIGVEKLHAVVGGSMGGMQALCFAARYPQRVALCAAIAATGHTSPSTVALRSVQRAAIRMDPDFASGWYSAEALPLRGMGVARRFGTICYRSRQEFDSRFSWEETEVGEVGGCSSSRARFEIENYLDHAASKFNYDPNCYLALSRAMDLMNLGASVEPRAGNSGSSATTAALAGFASTGGEMMLLPYSSDVLMPPAESKSLAAAWAGASGGASARMHCETLTSEHGHDAFLVRSEAPNLNSRLSAFLDAGADRVRSVYEQNVRDLNAFNLNV